MSALLTLPVSVLLTLPVSVLLTLPVSVLLTLPVSVLLTLPVSVWLTLPVSVLLTPVSYTHLDVYKRQVLSNDAESVITYDLSNNNVVRNRLRYAF